MSPDHAKQKIGELVRELRTRLDLNQMDFSRKLGFKGNNSIVSNLEAGRYDLSRSGVIVLQRLVAEHMPEKSAILLDLLGHAWVSP
jgi:transcriptional regulator with XRE-family HTH domain